MNYLDYSLQTKWESLTKFESPINLDSVSAKAAPLTAQPLKLNFAENGKLVKQQQINGDQFLASGSLQVGQQEYQLQRLHFHDGSEHTLDGKQLAGEIHLVYQNQTGNTLVLAILCQVTKDLSETLPLSQIYQEKSSISELAELLPTDLSYFTYVGSLTTPPLQPDVTWIVLKTPHLISASSQAALHTDYPDNHRQTQPVNGRKVLYFGN